MIPARVAYRLWAPSYEAENAVTTLEQLAVAELTPPLAGTSLLDAGCGTGRRLPRTGGAGPARVLGVDLVLEMLRAGRSADVALADIRALPCPADTFDVIWCRLAVGHLAEPAAAYAEFRRVARAGAHIVVTDFHPAAARAGHTRSFRDAEGELRTVEHFVHEIPEHASAALQAGLTLVAVQERVVGPNVRDYYERAQRLDLYEQQCGLPLVLALAFRT